MLRPMAGTWLKNIALAAATPAEQHLSALRGMLRRDYLTRADFDYALRDMATMARDALRARTALVAMFDDDKESWRAVTPAGEVLVDDSIASRASRSILEHVRATSMPLITAEGAGLNLSSASIASNAVESVLAVPVFLWVSDREQPQRRFGGCLYLDRTSGTMGFDQNDVELVLDICEIAQRNISLLQRLRETERTLEIQREELSELRALHATEYRLGDLTSKDRAFSEKVLKPLRRVASLDKVGILILGPTGTGKSHIARAFHNESTRRSGPFVTLDCAQITSSETLAAELFGYAPSSGYANAPPKGRPGKAELAHQGTLFIDEIGALPIELQQRFLALIQEGRFNRLGSSDAVVVDLQVIAATNEDLAVRIAEGRFREDLFWRLALVTVDLPPLSARPADIPDLAERLLASKTSFHKRAELGGFTPAALHALLAHDWSQAGNVRGLEHTIERAVVLAAPGTRQLDAADLQLIDIARARPSPPPVLVHSTPSASSTAPSSELERVKAAIVTHRSGTKAARALGLTYAKLIWELRRVGLSVRDVLLEQRK